MKGNEYRDLIGKYILSNFESRGISVYTEIRVGKSIIGKGRRIDIFVYDCFRNKAFAIECKYQGTQGTADEKIPYALADMSSLPMGGCIAYAGGGFSQGVLHMLQSSEIAAYCLPDELKLNGGGKTWELDHLLALHFGWWDIFLSKKNLYKSEHTIAQKSVSTCSLFT